MSEIQNLRLYQVIYPKFQYIYIYTARIVARDGLLAGTGLYQRRLQQMHVLICCFLLFVVYAFQTNVYKRVAATSCFGANQSLQATRP